MGEGPSGRTLRAAEFKSYLRVTKRSPALSVPIGAESRTSARDRRCRSDGDGGAREGGGR